MMEDIQRRRFRKSAPTIVCLSPSGRYRGSNLRCIPEEGLLDRKPGDEKDTRQISPTSSTSPCTLPPLFPRQHSILAFSALDHEDSPWELVNHERRKHGLPPFRLSRTLNRLSAEHASRMATEGTVYHSVSTIEELKVLLAGMDVAENIQRGDNVNAMHIETMQQRDCINRYNVLSTYFSEFGYGLAVGKDGKVYCCQLFRS
jgi:uncharacterized protein YkwD